MIATALVAAMLTVTQPQAELTDRGQVAVTYGGIPLLNGNSLLLMDEAWKALDRSSKGKMELTRTPDGDVATFASDLVSTTLTVSRENGLPKIEWQYAIKPCPEGRHLELCVSIPSANLDHLPATGKTHDYQQSSESLRLDTFSGPVELDVRGSTYPWSLDDMRSVAWAKRFRLRVAPPYDPAQGVQGTAVLRIKALPGESSAFLSLPVAAAGNRELVDEVAEDGKGGWTDQGTNDMRGLAAGRHVLFGVPLGVGSRAVILRGKERPAFPQRSPEIPVKAALSRLYLLQATAWSAPWRAPVAQLAVTYADGTKAEVPIRYGIDTTDWWNPSDPLEARLAWEGENAQATVGLCLMRWENPSPDREIASVRLTSTDSDAVPILVAAGGLRNGMLNSEQVAQLDRAFADRSQKAVSTDGWFPAPIAWRGGIEPGSALDVSSLNHRPAGKLGFVTVRDGHFAFADGTPVRFWGTNAALRGPFPPKDYAAGIAQTLAAQGVNLVRMHLYAVYDDTMIAPDGTLNPGALDRYENFVAELEKQGIYIYMDLNDGMLFDRLLGKKLPGDPKKLKMASLFNRELIDAQKDFARRLFTHVNPYTGKALVDDPAYAMFEITNENSMTCNWGNLESRLAKPYLDELTERWHAWLAEQGKSVQPLGGNLADGDSDGRRFGAVLQRAYLEEMYKYLRQIGVKAPICGTNITFTVGDLWASQAMDYTNDHAYHDHGSLHVEPKRFNNRNCVTEPSWRMGILPRFARAKMAGKPVVAGEWNYVFPNDYRSEGLPTMAAYAAFQGWDGLLFYCATGSFNGGSWQWFEQNNGAILIHTQQTDPSTWGLSQICALLYRRADVAPGRGLLTIDYNDSDIWRNHSLLDDMPFLPALTRVETQLTDKGSPKWLTDFPPETTAATRYEAALKQLGLPADNPAQVRSDTGEITRYSDTGILQVDSPRTQLALGFLANREVITLGDVQIRARTRFATIALSSLDGRPINESTRMLLAAVANARNTGTQFEGGRLMAMGKGPVIAEPVAAEVTINGARSLKAFALDTLSGHRKAEVPVKAGTIELSPASQTLYYELTRNHGH